MKKGYGGWGRIISMLNTASSNSHTGTGNYMDIEYFTLQFDISFISILVDYLDIQYAVFSVNGKVTTTRGLIAFLMV